MSITYIQRCAEDGPQGDNDDPEQNKQPIVSETPSHPKDVDPIS
jgi:hypothetical protein